jgi:uncharacterized repeat protein (TIGR01451 family)/LPXTG-motif cell wall-anchored protein
MSPRASARRPSARHRGSGRAGAPRRAGFLALALLTVTASLGLGVSSASAAPVYEITARWAPNTPGTVASGDVVNAEWRVNVNDDAEAPSNDPVDNVNFTLTIDNGTFQNIPDSCLTAGVDPVSSISADKKTLICNLGIQDEGSAHLVNTGILADGPTGSQITGTGTIAGATAALDPIDIVNPFGMDMRWNTGTANFSAGSGTFDMDMEWTLSKNTGSEPGPQTVTYDLTIVSPQGGTIVVGPQGCTPFTGGFADGHPWSGGTHPANQLDSFVGTCTLTKTGPNAFQLTLTGIDYTPASPPTLDSTGSKLPTDEVALASGSIWIRVMTSQAGSVQLTSNAPTYTSTSGQTAQDDASNNTESKAWTTPGLYSSGWGRGYTGSGGTTWDNTYRVAAGTPVGQYMDTDAQLNDSLPDSFPVGMCSKLDTKYVTFNNWSWGSPPGGVAGAVVEYYTGSAPTMDPASGSYDPNAFGCGGSAGWTTTQPADPSLVKAVRITMTEAQARAYKAQNITPVVGQIIKPDTPVGTDVWSFMEAQVAGDGSWYKRDEVCVTPIPGGRYPCTTGFADVVHIVSATPAVRKTVDRAVVTPGVPATYTLTYSANGSGAIPDTVDDFGLVDTLPAGMTYVPGSADPEPTVTTSGGQQVLTWSLDNVPTNADQPLSYQAVASASVEPGQVLTNTVEASLAGLTANGRAQVTVATNGYTTISKTADQAFIPNLNGDGVGAGSWTVTLRSFDPLPQAYTDTIDILPYEGDKRGTSFSGDYSLAGVDAVAGATVYYTTADPATLSDDPADASNGGANSPAGNTVGWTTTYTANATAVRVIAGELAPGATQQFKVRVTTDGAKGGDLYVNRAQARDGHTELKMRTSAPISVANYYSASLKKYVQGIDGTWHDANDVADYPAFHYGDTVKYRIVVTNTGQGTLTNVDVTDDKQPADGAFHIDTLAPGQHHTHEFEMVLNEDTDSGTIVNTACAAADTPSDSQVAPTINCDPAGLEVTNYTTVKTSDPKPGSEVKAGDTVTYTVKVTQEGTVPAAAVFSDDLSDVLDDTSYNRDVKASIGIARVSGDTLAWSGTIPVGEVATITYSVTVDDDVNGNAKLVNVVTSPGCQIVDGKTPYCTTNHHTGSVSPDSAGVLPDTGGTSALMVLLGVLLLSVGGYIVIWSRRDTEALHR